MHVRVTTLAVLRVGDIVHIDGGPGVRVDGIEKFRKTLDRGAVLTAAGEDSSTAFII